jgi:hypothetical protein
VLDVSHAARYSSTYPAWGGSGGCVALSQGMRMIDVVTAQRCSVTTGYR